MFFKSFDFLGLVFGFSYDDSIRYQTNFGGFFSVVLAMLSIIIGISMGLSFFNRDSPRVLQSKHKYWSPPPIIFDKRFNFAVRMTVAEEHMYKELDMVRVKLTQHLVYKSNFSNITSVEIAMEKCDKSSFPHQQENYEKFLLNETLCPDMNGKKIVGDAISEYFQWFQIKFYLCENDPLTGKSKDGSNIVCKNKNEIIEFLRKNVVKAHLFYTDSEYFEDNYLNPEENYINNYNVEVRFDTIKESHFFLYVNNLTSDDTYFFLTPSQRKFSNVAFSYVSETSYVKEQDEDSLVLINIRADKITIDELRTYTGFSETAASIGAILNIVFLFFNCLVFLYSRMEFFARLVNNSLYLHYTRNKLPNLKQIRKIDKEIKQTKVNQGGKMFIEDSNLNLNQNTSNNNVLQIVTEPHKNILKQSEINTDHTKSLRPQIEVLTINKKDLLETKNSFITPTVNQELDIKKKYEEFSLLRYNQEIKFFELIVFSFCPCFKICSKKLNQDFSIIEYSKKHYYKYTDFFKFLDKFVELNILKKLLLSKEELEVFDVLKRVVLIKNHDLLEGITKQNVNKHIGNKLKSKGSLQVMEEKLKKYINSISLKGEKTLMENNLLEKFEEIFKA